MIIGLLLSRLDSSLLAKVFLKVKYRVQGNSSLFSFLVENNNSSSRSVPFPELHPIQILGSQSRTAQTVGSSMPAVSCSVCGVVKKSKEDKAYRLVTNVTIVNDDNQTICKNKIFRV